MPLRRVRDYSRHGLTAAEVSAEQGAFLPPIAAPGAATELAHATDSGLTRPSLPDDIDVVGLELVADNAAARAVVGNVLLYGVHLTHGITDYAHAVRMEQLQKISEDAAEVLRTADAGIRSIVLAGDFNLPPLALAGEAAHAGLWQVQAAALRLAERFNENTFVGMAMRSEKRTKRSRIECA